MRLWWGQDDEVRKMPCREGEHEWEYVEREPGETYTGYLERCKRCGLIVRVPQ
jgi:hypothetical protein